MKKLAFIALLMAASPLVCGQNNPLTDDDEVLDAPPKRTITVRGVVTDCDGTQVLLNSGVVIMGIKLLYNSKGEMSGMAELDIGGKYEISGVPENGTLVFFSMDCAPKKVKVGGRSRIDVQLDKQTDKTINVSGTVRDKNYNPIGNVYIETNKSALEKLVGGRYNIENIPEDAYILFLHKATGIVQMVLIEGRTRIDVVF